MSKPETDTLSESPDATIARIGVSMNPELLPKVAARKKELKFRSRSAYMEALVRADLGLQVNPKLIVGNSPLAQRKRA